jgi:hypothetical protein
MNRCGWCWTAVLVALAFPLPALAHEYWLAPNRYRVSAGDTLSLGAWVGTGFRGEARPYAPSRAVRFVLSDTRTLDLSRAGRNGELIWARVVASDGGGALVGYASDFVPISLPAAEFDRYLALEGLDAPLAARRRLGSRAGAGRERYARCPKVWISGSDASRASRPLGLPLEIVPLSAPGSTSRLTVRVLSDGRPLAGALVRAWRRPLAAGSAPLPADARDSVGVASEQRTARDGTVTLDVGAAGEWLISTVHMVKCREREAADWESLWASLTFAREAAHP